MSRVRTDPLRSSAPPDWWDPRATERRILYGRRPACAYHAEQLAAFSASPQKR
jgi:hypothetical protein